MGRDRVRGSGKHGGQGVAQRGFGDVEQEPEGAQDHDRRVQRGDGKGIKACGNVGVQGWLAASSGRRSQRLTAAQKNSRSPVPYGTYGGD